MFKGFFHKLSHQNAITVFYIYDEKEWLSASKESFQ